MCVPVYRYERTVEYEKLLSLHMMLCWLRGEHARDSGTLSTHFWQ